MRQKPTPGQDWFEKQVYLNQTSNWRRMVGFASI